MTFKLTKRQVLLGGAAAGVGLTLGTDVTLAQGATIKFGCAGPLTGPNAAFGEQLKRGTQAAVDAINAAGGMNGAKITVEFGDDRSDPKEGVSVANKFVSGGVKFVCGHFNSGVTIPASEVYAEGGIAMITPSATNPTVTERGLWNVARTCGRDDQQGAIAGEYILKNKKTAKLAILHDKTPYGKGLADFTKATVNKGGVTEVLYEGVNVGEKDFSALVSKMKQANVEVVYWGGLHTEGGLIVRQMRDQGLSAVMMAADGITTKEFWAVAGPGAEGTLMTFPPDPRKNPAAKDAVAKFKAAGYDPEAYTLYSYAVVQIIVEAAKEAKSLDPKKVMATIRSGKQWPTVIGPIGYDKKGDITRPDYVMYVWKNGDYVEL